MLIKNVEGLASAKRFLSLQTMCDKTRYFYVDFTSQIHVLSNYNACNSKSVEPPEKQLSNVEKRLFNIYFLNF